MTRTHAGDALLGCRLHTDEVLLLPCHVPKMGRITTTGSSFSSLWQKKVARDRKNLKSAETDVLTPVTFLLYNTFTKVLPQHGDIAKVCIFLFITIFGLLGCLLAL